MAKQFSITVENKRVFSRRMKQRISGLAVQGELIENQTAKSITELAQEFVAVDTGKTRDNIHPERRGKDMFVVSDRGGDKPEVAVYLEFGTSRMAAQPYLVPAAHAILASRGLKAIVRGVGGLLVT